MTLIMLTATTVPVLAGASEQTDGRSTGNESVSADVSGVFYERGNSISVTVMSTNLDPSTEYTINWELCFAAYNNCNLYSEMAASGGSDPTETEGTMDLGSGNMFTTSVFTFTDPGLFEDDGMNGISGIMNQSYHFRVTLDTQGIELETIQSSAFVLGGEMRDQSYIDNIGNLLKNTPIEFNGRIYFDYENQNLLDYGLDCSLYEGASTTAVDTYSIENITTSQSYVYFYSTVVANNSAGDELLPLASSGIHRVECSLMRNIDATVMGTMVSNDFSVIDADVTGLEEIHVDDLTTVFYERSLPLQPRCLPFQWNSQICMLEKHTLPIGNCVSLLTTIVIFTAKWQHLATPILLRQKASSRLHQPPAPSRRPLISPTQACLKTME